MKALLVLCAAAGAYAGRIEHGVAYYPFDGKLDCKNHCTKQLSGAVVRIDADTYNYADRLGCSQCTALGFDTVLTDNTLLIHANTASKRMAKWMTALESVYFVTAAAGTRAAVNLRWNLGPATRTGSRLYRAFDQEECRQLHVLTGFGSVPSCTQLAGMRVCSHEKMDTLGMRGYAATPQTMQEMKEIESLPVTGAFWLGLTDWGLEGRYKWITGNIGCSGCGSYACQKTGTGPARSGCSYVEPSQEAACSQAVEIQEQCSGGADVVNTFWEPGYPSARTGKTDAVALSLRLQQNGVRVGTWRDEESGGGGEFGVLCEWSPADLSIPEGDTWGTGTIANDLCDAPDAATCNGIDECKWQGGRCKERDCDHLTNQADCRLLEGSCAWNSYTSKCEEWEDECDSHASTCTAQGQYCSDPQPFEYSKNDWMCRCPPPSDRYGMQAPADCVVDECTTHGALCAAGAQVCNDPNKGLQSLDDWGCVCPPGYQPQALSVKDLVPSCMPTTPCQPQARATCEDKLQLCEPGGLMPSDFRCECIAPATGQVGNNAPASCQLDECTASCPTCQNYVCSNAFQGCNDPNQDANDPSSYGDWVCECQSPGSGPPGLRSPTFCDLDECAGNSACPVSQRCEDFNHDVFSSGDWYCICPPERGGQVKKGGPATCSVDECDVREGAKLNLETCEDVKQTCKDPNPSQFLDWECHCTPPAVGSPVVRGPAACEVDECTTTANCTAAAQTCDDPDKKVLDDWVCACVAPETGTAVGTQADCKLDECLVYRTNCTSAGQSCEDPNQAVRGDWMCVCQAPFSGGAVAAQANCTVDECATAPGVACTVAGQACNDPNWTTLNDFICLCPPPSVGSGVGQQATCALDECANGANCSTAGQTCADPDLFVQGNWKCSCPAPNSGITAVGTLAACPVDECAGSPGSPNVCDAGGQDCDDPDKTKQGDFVCTCRPPFLGPPKVGGLSGCWVDECTNIANCSSAGQDCVDPNMYALGDFMCKCPPPGSGQQQGGLANCGTDECLGSNVCVQGGQVCKDPDWFTTGDIECSCRSPLVGSPAQNSLAVCFVDECAAGATQPPVANCSQAGQDCNDPNLYALGDFVCSCKPPQQGQPTVGNQAKCELDECADQCPTCPYTVCASASPPQECKDFYQNVPDSWKCMCVAPLQGYGYRQLATCTAPPSPPPPPVPPPAPPPVPPPLPLPVPVPVLAPPPPPVPMPPPQPSPPPPPSPPPCPPPQPPPSPPPPPPQSPPPQPPPAPPPPPPPCPPPCPAPPSPPPPLPPSPPPCPPPQPPPSPPPPPPPCPPPDPSPPPPPSPPPLPPPMPVVTMPPVALPSASPSATPTVAPAPLPSRAPFPALPAFTFPPSAPPAASPSASPQQPQPSASPVVYVPPPSASPSAAPSVPNPSASPSAGPSTAPSSSSPSGAPVAAPTPVPRRLLAGADPNEKPHICVCRAGELESMTSINVHSNAGAVVRLRLGGGYRFVSGLGRLLLRVLWGCSGGTCQGSVGSRHASALQSSCSGQPCISITTDTTPSDSPEGLAATAQRNPDAMLAEVVADSDDGWPDAVQLTLKDNDFRAFAPNTEKLTVSMAGDMLDESVRDSLCGSQDTLTGAEGVFGCICRGGVISASTCRYEAVISVHSEPNTFAGRDDLAATQGTAAAGVMIGSAVLGSSPSTGGSLVRMAMITGAASCPQDGPEKLDRSLNPLGLEIGSGVNASYAGAVVGNLLIRVVLVFICALMYKVLLEKLEREARPFRTFGRLREEYDESPLANYRDLPAKVRILHPGIRLDATLDKRWVKARARWGWLLIPLPFLYGGTMLAGVAAVLYCDLPFKLIGGADVLTFGIGFPYYVFRTVKRGRKKHARLQTAEGISRRKTPLKWFFWGSVEWVPKEDKAEDRNWMDLHHLTFDAYRVARMCKYFLLCELVHTAVLSAVTAWQPRDTEQCWEKTVAMTVILASLFLSRLILQPYIAPYENLIETLLAGVEVAMMACVVIMLGEQRPSESNMGKVVTVLGNSLMYGVIFKFLLDATIFMIDEYGVWMDQGGSGSMCGFLVYVFFFKGATVTAVSDGNEGREPTKTVTHPPVRPPSPAPSQPAVLPRAGPSEQSTKSEPEPKLFEASMPVSTTASFTAEEPSAASTPRGKSARARPPAGRARRQTAVSLNVSRADDDVKTRPRPASQSPVHGTGRGRLSASSTSLGVPKSPTSVPPARRGLGRGVV